MLLGRPMLFFGGLSLLYSRMYGRPYIQPYINERPPDERPTVYTCYINNDRLSSRRHAVLKELWLYCAAIFWHQLFLLLLFLIIRKPVSRPLSVKSMYFLFIYFLKSSGSQLFLRLGGLRKYNNFFFGLMSIYGNINISKITKLAPWELSHLVQNHEINCSRK